ncbi:hypothetical protein KHQ81_07370 [Mycoplasmatota bacterium]|nr:hypothetical protein KHQ81_07370 [Mycoplasmatota bacterium]
MDLNNMYFIGGSPCCGKSTISEKLAEKYGFYYYKVDDYYEQHMKEGAKRGYSMMSKLSKLSWDDIFSRDINTQVNEELLYYKEELNLIIEDLEKLDCEKPIIVEGAAILPEFIEKMNIKKNKSIFMVPTPSFQINHYRKREWRHWILNQCKSPDKAFGNWMKRDIEFAKVIIKEARKNYRNFIIVDEDQSLETNFKKVEKFFNLG